MIVIKLGGSLMESGGLDCCLDTVERSYNDGAVILVPGGGAFAEQVRISQQRMQFDDRTAHHMAILAMQQTALLYKALRDDFVLMHKLADLGVLLQRHNVLIWSPDVNELDQAGIPASWDITSDSLAAWLAGSLSAEQLILVKSVNVDRSLTANELVARNVVDAAFFGYVSKYSLTIKIVGKEEFCRYPGKLIDPAH